MTRKPADPIAVFNLKLLRPVPLMQVPLTAQALGHQRLADYNIGRGYEFDEHTCSGGMYVARAVGREGIVPGIYLGGPEQVRIVLGTVDSIEESARFLRKHSAHSRVVMGSAGRDRGFGENAGAGGRQGPGVVVTARLDGCMPVPVPGDGAAPVLLAVHREVTRGSP